MTRAEFDRRLRAFEEDTGTATYVRFQRYPITAWEDDWLSASRRELQAAQPADDFEKLHRAECLAHVEAEIMRRKWHR